MVVLNFLSYFDDLEQSSSFVFHQADAALEWNVLKQTKTLLFLLDKERVAVLGVSRTLELPVRLAAIVTLNSVDEVKKNIKVVQPMTRC